MSLSLTVQKRDVLGKKVKALYRDGLIVGNLYGRGKDSLPISGEYEMVRKVAEEAGKNHAIELKVEGDGDHLVLIKNVDRNPATARIRHIEFQMVSRTEKIEAEVPVELVGTSPAVLAGNMIMTLNDTVMVEANPQSLPDHLELNAELLVNPDDMLTVDDLTMPAGVELKSEAGLALFKVEVPRSQVEAEGETEVISAADVPADHGSDKTDDSK